MDFQRILNKLKRIIDELWDLLMKKESEGLDADDMARLDQIKEAVAKIEAEMSAKGGKVSVIQEAIQTVKELIDDIEGRNQTMMKTKTPVEGAAKEVIDEILDHPDVYLHDTEEEPNKREENVELLKGCAKYLKNEYRRDEIDRVIR